jgi:hypothetical protein
MRKIRDFPRVCFRDYTVTSQRATSLLELLLGAELVGMSTLLLSAVLGARGQARVAPKLHNSESQLSCSDQTTAAKILTFCTPSCHS